MSWIETEDDLRALVAEIKPGRVWVDTEYDNQRRFDARLALVQIAWDDGEVLVDPLEVELTSLAGWGGDWLSHDGTHDWYLMALHGWTPPARCLDTQIAARLLGYERFGLAALAEEILQIELDKSEQRSDWLRRPLSDEQRTYALGDVVHLRAMTQRLEKELDERGLKQAWFEESQIVLDRALKLGDRGPKAFHRVKHLRKASPLAYGRAQVILDWRFARAKERDLPEFKILGDALIVRLAIGTIRPKERELQQLLKKAQPLDWPKNKRRSDEELALEKQLKAWRTEVADQRCMDFSMVLPPKALEQLAAGVARQEIELLSGWRAVHFGEALDQLLQ